LQTQWGLNTIKFYMNGALYIIFMLLIDHLREIKYKIQKSSDSSVSEEIHSTYAFNIIIFKYKEHVSKKKRYQDKTVLFY